MNQTATSSCVVARLFDHRKYTTSFYVNIVDASNYMSNSLCMNRTPRKMKNQLCYPLFMEASSQFDRSNDLIVSKHYPICLKRV
jgi:hypothetical protein